MRINDELINEILSQYDDCMESGILDDIELDYEKKQFVQGYLCRMKQQGNEKNTDYELIRSQIIQTRSKYCEPILELLANEGELYHGDLAERLNVSPSGLNAIIKKMQETEPSIIHTTQIGKYKIYSLPEDVQNYILKKEDTPTSDKTEDVYFTQRTGEEKKDAFLSLQHFIELAGNDWKDYLNTLFRGVKSNITETVKAEFDVFIEAVGFLYADGSEHIDRLKRMLNNPVLVFLLDEYMENYEVRKKIHNEIKKRIEVGELTLLDRQILKNEL